MMHLSVRSIQRLSAIMLPLVIPILTGIYPTGLAQSPQSNVHSWRAEIQNIASASSISASLIQQSVGLSQFYCKKAGFGYLWADFPLNSPTILRQNRPKPTSNRTFFRSEPESPTDCQGKRISAPNTSSTDTLEWSPPRFEARQKDRHAMVRNQIKARGIDDPQVLSAMRHVPRHLFVPDQRSASAYEDRPLPIGHGQTISQPFIVAYMTQVLNLDSTDKVLEIGTGSGYQAAVLSEITPHVFTIEIIKPLATQAEKRFEKVGYEIIKAKAGDGYYGWKKYAPFDAIIVTAAAGHIPAPLLQQLKSPGTMVIPVGSTYDVQKLMKVRKTAKGKIRTKSLMPVRFVPMTGAVRHQQR